MYPFAGQLNQNEVYGTLYNQIISILTHSKNIVGTYGQLYNEARVEGSMYGDQKLFIDTDILESHPWLGHVADEASNLLALNYAADPAVQSIKLDQKRQIRLTIDSYLSKRSFGAEGTFAEFIGVLLDWIKKTQDVHMATMYNAFIGTNKSSTVSQNIEFTLPNVNESGLEGGYVEKEAINRLRAQTLGQKLADLVVDLKDVTRKYNDYGYMRSLDESDIKFIFNSKYVNELRNMDLPTIFHNEGILNKIGSHILPERFFGTVQGAIASGANDGTYRSMVEKTFGTGTAAKHCFPGDLIPAGVALESGESYKNDDKVICKIYTTLPPVMSGFEVATSFFNGRSLTENKYLTWMFSKPEHLLGKPCITIKEA